MKYGYTIADAASREVFEEAVQFIIEKLHFKPSGDTLENIYGDLKKEFIRDDCSLILESDTEVDYVAIISDIELPIDCLHEWTEP